MLLVETADILSVPLFTAKALLRNHGMLLLVETADMLSVPLFTAKSNQIHLLCLYNIP
jgi:hypothetical protein